jgi:hypothetical protein
MSVPKIGLGVARHPDGTTSAPVAWDRVRVPSALTWVMLTGAVVVVKRRDRGRLAVRVLGNRPRGQGALGMPPAGSARGGAGGTGRFPSL